jgi:NAD(P)H-hydrate epimerase
MGVAVEADYTVTFGLPKVGNMLYPGYAYGGELFVSHISFPPSLYSSDSLKVEVFNPLRLPWRALDSHKGDYGKALFIAGSSSYLGAPYFSAMSFLKAGGGLSYLAAPKSISQFVVGRGSEIISVPQPETKSGSIAKESKEELLKFAEDVDVVVLGPGVSLNRGTQGLTRELAVGLGKPLIIDGDGITAVAEDAGALKKREALTVLTPHIGEMSRLAGMKIDRLKKDKIGVLRRTAEEFDAIVVLKGAHTLTGYPDGKVVINTSGNPGMATAGSGDVLTGTIAAMYGLGLEFEDAVPVGVFMHGLAGDLAVADGGEDGITAQDVLDYLPSALKMYREEFSLISRDFYGCIRAV